MLTRFTHTVLRASRHRTQQGLANSVVRFAVGGSGFVMLAPGCSASACPTSGAELLGAPIAGAESGAELPGAELPGAELPGAELPGAELPGAEMSGAEMSGAELPGAELPGAAIQEHSSGIALGAMLDASLGAIAAIMGAILPPFLGGASLIRCGGNADHLGRFISLKPIVGIVFGRPTVGLSTPIQPGLNFDDVQPKSGRFRLSPTSP